MKLAELLDVLSVKMPFTVGTLHGQGWIAYYDGEGGKRRSLIPGYLTEREIVNIYPRERREGSEMRRELKAGLAVIVDGHEDGDI